LNSLFEESPKKKATKLRFAPVETECELIEVRLKVIRLHRPLMSSKQPSLEEAGYAVNSW
jgi:hypothetical protein